MKYLGVGVYSPHSEQEVWVLLFIYNARIIIILHLTEVATNASSLTYLCESIHFPEILCKLNWEKNLHIISSFLFQILFLYLCRCTGFLIIYCMKLKLPLIMPEWSMPSHFNFFSVVWEVLWKVWDNPAIIDSLSHWRISEIFHLCTKVKKNCQRNKADFCF